MKSAIIFTGTGPILILTTYDSLEAPQFLEKLEAKGIGKFIGCEVPMDLVKSRYGTHFSVVMNDIKQTDDLRILDFNGYTVFHNFAFAEWGEPVYHEPESELHSVV